MPRPGSSPSPPDEIDPTPPGDAAGPAPPPHDRPWRHRRPGYAAGAPCRIVQGFGPARPSRADSAGYSCCPQAPVFRGNRLARPPVPTPATLVLSQGTGVRVPVGVLIAGQGLAAIGRAGHARECRKMQGQPWFRRQTWSWYIEVRGRQHPLGKHPSEERPVKGKRGWSPPPEIVLAWHARIRALGLQRVRRSDRGAPAGHAVRRAGPPLQRGHPRPCPRRHPDLVSRLHRGLPEAAPGHQGPRDQPRARPGVARRRPPDPLGRLVDPGGDLCPQEMPQLGRRGGADPGEPDREGEEARGKEPDQGRHRRRSRPTSCPGSRRGTSSATSWWPSGRPDAGPAKS